VAKATEQVEEMRLISERAMYLGSRLPMLTGAFADVWTSRLTRNQDVDVILADVNRIADGLQRIAAVSEKLPDDIAKERDTTINKLIQEVAKQRRETIEDFLAEEKRIRGLLTELKLMLASGKDLLISTNAILDRLNIGQREVGATEPSTPFDIKDYQATLQEASRPLQRSMNW
jgi:alanyl-tRNA synthetase